MGGPSVSLQPVSNPPQQRIKKKKKRKYRKVRFYEVKRLRRARLRSEKKRKERELRELQEQQQALIMLPGMVPIKEEPQESIASYQSVSSISSNERLMQLARAAQLEMMSRSPVKIEKGITPGGKRKRTRKLAPNTLPLIPGTIKTEPHTPFGMSPFLPGF